MERTEQIAFLSKADERQQARWARKMANPEFVEKLRVYDAEVAAPVPVTAYCA